MTPANGHANDSANIPTTAVQQIAPPASDTNISTALTPNAAKIKELIASLEVPFHPSVIEWRVTNTSKGGSPLRRNRIFSLGVHSASSAYSSSTESDRCERCFCAASSRRLSYER